MVESTDDTVVEENYELLSQLDLAMHPVEAVESSVDDFALALFRTLGYNHRPHVVRSRPKIPLLICGEYKYAKPDICIIDRSRNDIVQLVAEGVAAFQNNNARRMASGLDPLESKVRNLWQLRLAC